MNCDICGKEVSLVKAIVEGIELSVCRECSNFGNVIEQKKPEKTKPKRPTYPTEEVIDVMVSDYTDKIKKAREKMNLKQKEFAQKIAEKESVIQNIESGHIKPSIALARKIEKFCHIKLVEEHKEEHKNVKLNLKDTSLTIGDLLNLKKE